MGKLHFETDFFGKKYQTIDMEHHFWKDIILEDNTIYSLS